MPPVSTPLNGDVDLVKNVVRSIGGVRITTSKTAGKPTTGRHNIFDLHLDAATPAIYMCTVAGNPGSWASI